MKVSDHGAGFETEKLEEDQSVYGFGLASMRERLALLGGELHVESALDQGTRVVASVPWDAQGGTCMGETGPYSR